MLDDDNVYNWFASPFIVELSLIAVAALVAFVLEFVNPRPLVNFRLLGRRNLEFRCCGPGDPRRARRSAPLFDGARLP